MKYATIIFTKVLSGLCQQEVFSKKKRDNLVSAWKEAVSSNDRKTLMALVVELEKQNKNPMWAKQLNEIKEKI